MQVEDSWPAECLQSAAGRLGRDLLANVREAARKTWGKLQFPSVKLEEWKYTGIDQIVRSKFELPPTNLAAKINKGELGHHFLGELDSSKLVFVNGIFNEELSNLESVNSGMVVRRTNEGVDADLESLAALVGFTGAHETHAFPALNLALVADTVLVQVKKGVQSTKPLHIVHVVTEEAKQTVISPRLLVVAEEGSSGSIIESFIGQTEASYFTNSAAEIIVRAKAVFDLCRVQNESLEAAHFSHTVMRKDRDAQGNVTIFSFGGKLVRNHVEVVFGGENSSGTVNGLTVLSGDQHVDNATVIEHAKPHCESSELFKGIYADRSRGVFGGTIIVQPGAQKTNAYQSNQTLLLSDQASIDTRPQLKIWADDVKCTHGATIGQLDEKALMYLRARGIDKASAKQFLIHAFASELTAVRWPEVRNYIELLLTAKLREGALE